MAKLFFKKKYNKQQKYADTISRNAMSSKENNIPVNIILDSPLLELMLASQLVLSKDWLTQEEEKAWEDM